MGTTQQKGDLGVALILAEVVRRGYKVAIPMGEDWPFDLIVWRQDKLERVQCKYTESDGETIKVPCRSVSEWVQYKYTPEMIDWLAVYDKTSNRCFFLPASLLEEGKAQLNLRLIPPKNGQEKGIRFAENFIAF